MPYKLPKNMVTGMLSTLVIRKGANTHAQKFDGEIKEVVMREKVEFNRSDIVADGSTNDVVNLDLTSRWPGTGWAFLRVNKSDLYELYKVQGSGKKPWEVMINMGDINQVSCNCPSWLYQKGERKDCKHIRIVLGT